MSIVSVKPNSILRALRLRWTLTYTVCIIALAALSTVFMAVYYLSHQAYIHLRLSYKVVPVSTGESRVVIHAQIANTGVDDAVIKDILIRETPDGVKYSEVHKQWFQNKILKSKGIISWDTDVPSANYTHFYTVELTTSNNEVFTSKPKRFR